MARKTTKPKKSLECPFTVIVDTRETLPYRFEGLTGNASQNYRPLIVNKIWQSLPTGDYSIEGFEDVLCIERKTLADLFGSVGGERARFEREHQRMREMVDAGGFACVLIEATRHACLYRPPKHSKTNSRSVYETGMSWSIKYRVPWIFTTGRSYAERDCFSLLEKFWRSRPLEARVPRKVKQLRTGAVLDVLNQDGNELLVATPSGQDFVLYLDEVEVMGWK
jgi:ERCC4-type nuclease